MLNTMDEKDLWNDPVRRYMLPAFDDRHPEWPSHPKASRDSLHEIGYVGRGRPDAPLPNKSVGGNALHLFAILRPLHAHGSGRERRAASREDEVSDPAKGSLPADARLSARDAFRPRRCGERRRHCQHAHRHAGGVLLQADGHPEHQGHPPGHERPDRHPAALFCRRTCRRDSTAWRKRRANAAWTLPCTRT